MDVSVLKSAGVRNSEQPPSCRSDRALILAGTRVGPHLKKTLAHIDVKLT